MCVSACKLSMRQPLPLQEQRQIHSLFINLHCENGVDGVYVCVDLCGGAQNSWRERETHSDTGEK